MIDSEIGMKELARKHPANAHNKRLLIRTSQVCHRRRAAGRNQQVEEYKHTHTLPGTVVYPGQVDKGELLSRHPYK